MALGRLPSGRSATLPIRRDWTRVGWLSPSFPFINTPSLGNEEGEGRMRGGSTREPKKKDKIKGQRKKERNRSRKTNRETTRGRKKKREELLLPIFGSPYKKKEKKKTKNIFGKKIYIYIYICVCVSVAIHLGPWNFISCNFNLN
jgi:hypothetical protein